MLGGIANWHLVAPNLSLIAPLHFLNSSSFQCCFGTALLWVRTLCFPEWSPTQTPESTCFLQILAHKLKQKILTWYPHIAQILGSECWSHQAAPVGDRLHFHFSLSSIGEGNGNPLQCSCLENPRDGEPGGLPSLGSHRVGHDWSDLAAAAAAYWVIVKAGWVQTWIFHGSFPTYLWNMCNIFHLFSKK